MSFSVNSKLPGIGPTIFTQMSALAAEKNAVNLGQGFPDFSMDEELQQLLFRAVRDGHNQYAHAHGYLPLRERIAEKVLADYDHQLNAGTDITITPGGTYAIYTAITAVLEKDDEAIFFEPAYDSYAPNILVNGGRAVRISLRLPDFSIDWQLVKEAINERTRLIIINSPHNPSGSLLSATDLQQLKALTAGTNILIVSDEVYEHLVFDGKKHQSMLSDPELAARSFVCFSFGKTYHCTGWKIGYCVAPKDLTTEFRKIHQFNCFSVFSPAQVAFAEFLKKKDAYRNLSALIQGKRDYFNELMQESRFTPIHSSGTYFQLFSYERISDENDRSMALRLVNEFGVASIPISAFYTEGEYRLLRFCFAKNETTLLRAAKALCRV